MTTDNSEVCHISLSGIRKHTSFRCDSELWRVFKQICVKNGLSTCDILEKLIMGFCVGITQPSVAHPTTIYVVVDAPRVVKRVRRQLVFENEVWEGLNVAEKLELKLVKKDLTVALEALEKGKGDKSFYLGMLRNAVQRAVKTFNKYEDKELYSLLEKADKWI